MTDEVLFIKEAAEPARMSEKSVGRRYKKILYDAELGKLIGKRKVGNVCRYFVSKSFVEKCVMKKIGTHVSETRSTAAGDSNVLLQQRSTCFPAN